MGYIPEAHKKYNLLPVSTEEGWEVFSYPSALENEISKMLPDDEHVIPYGYKSYAAFDEKLDSYIAKYGKSAGVLNKLGHKLLSYKEAIHRMNIKENWSVLKYVGESTPNMFGLTHGKYYYWPCSIECPEYKGVIDDEEFTAYLSYEVSSEPPQSLNNAQFTSYSESSTTKVLWEIAEDPTGMAAKTLASRSST